MISFFRRYQFELALLIVIGVAAFLRLWQVGNAPAGLLLDEAAYGNDAIEVAETGKWNVFYPDNYGREGMFITIAGVVFKLFGIGVVQLRSVTAIAGVLTVVGLYFFVKQWTDKMTATVASFLLAISFWHVMFSHIAFRAGFSPLLLVWSLFFLSRALQHRRWKDWIVSGVFFGLGFYTYLAFRAVVFLLPLLVFYTLWQTAGGRFSIRLKQWWVQWGKGWLIVATTTALTLIPFVVYFIHHPDHLVTRSLPISIFVKEYPFWEFIKNMATSMGMYFHRGDPAWQHNIAGKPELLFPVMVFVVVGIITLLQRRNRARYPAVFVWLIFLTWCTMLLPGALTTEYLPHSLRTINTLIPVYALAGIGAVQLYEAVKNRWSLFAKPFVGVILAVLFLGALGIVEGYKYFGVWVPSPESHCRALSYHADIARQINALPDGAKAYIIADVPGIPIDQSVLATQSLQFLTHQSGKTVIITPDTFNRAQVQEGDMVVSIMEEELKHPCPSL